jgi:hypothetical protein
MGLLQSAKTSFASIFLYLIGAGFAFLVGYEIFTKQPVDAIALSFVYGALTFAVNSAGTKSGVDHTNETVSKVAVAQYPMTPNGISAVRVEAANIAANQAVQDQKATTAQATGEQVP